VDAGVLADLQLGIVKPEHLDLPHHIAQVAGGSEIARTTRPPRSRAIREHFPDAAIDIHRYRIGPRP
jgi:hypothetical protein